jgi:hypothetical protein
MTPVAYNKSAFWVLAAWMSRAGGGGSEVFGGIFYEFAF